MHETFWTLLQDRAHWEFEIFLMVLFDGLILGALFPFVRKHWRHHITRDNRDQNNEVCDAMFGSELPPIWPRSGRFYEPVKGKPCPRCGIGVDDDGDGNCSVCARVSDVHLRLLKEQEMKFKTWVPDAMALLKESEDRKAAMGEPVLGKCDEPGGDSPHPRFSWCWNWKPLTQKTRKNHG